MNLYKILVDGAEFIHYAYHEFIVITSSKQKVIEIVYKFACGSGEEIPDYLSEKNLKIECIGSIYAEEKFCDQVISYVYKE